MLNKENVPGVNSLDTACKNHDFAYLHNEGDREREIADKNLQEKAKQIYKDKTKKISERSAAFLVNKVMAIKRHLGGSIVNCKIRRGKKNQENDQKEEII